MKIWGGFFDIAAKERKIADLEAQAARPEFWSLGDQSQKVMAQISQTKNLVNRWKQLSSASSDIAAHLELTAEIAEPAEQEKELSDVEKNLIELIKKYRALDLESKLSGEHDASNAIVALHAGVGGTEACDWNEMLFRMFQRWAASKGFETEITDILMGEEAGVKSVTFFVKGAYAYGYLKSEIGVHRLVRVSPFDANKRRHTSFASCDVIPEITDDIKIDINESDLRIDTYRASGAGGQHVNKTESAVRITHNPSGIIVACQIDRSQIKNRATAMKMLRARLYEVEQEKKRASIEKHYDEKGGITWGNQIRSYVFMPYQLVKDLRTGEETGNIQAVMDGALDPFMYAYLSKKEKK